MAQPPRSTRMTRRPGAGAASSGTNKVAAAPETPGTARVAAKPGTGRVAARPGTGRVPAAPATPGTGRVAAGPAPDPRLASTADQQADAKALAQIKSQLGTTWSGVPLPKDPDQTVGTALVLKPGSMLGFVARTRVVVAAGSGDAGDTGADYELGERLGAGGMGEVYLARQVALGREIALKVLRDDLSGRNDVQVKFLLEAAVTAELEHPGIVPVYDLGVDPLRRALYAMKLVKGTTWNEVIDQRSLSENLEILLKVADAIAFAHSKGVIHRDLKPDNVMLGEFGEVQVLDWGLAAAATPGSSAPRLADCGIVAGTPSYMAPEMALGDVPRIGFSSDIYLLGGLLYRILSGRAPHPGTDIRTVVLNAACNTIDRIPDGGELQEIALRAMSTMPERRHITVRDFQRDIRRFQEHHASIELCRLANADMERVAADGGYEEFAKAVGSYREAIRLWDGNVEARAGLAAAQLAYARMALSRGDLDLADSLLASSGREQQELRATVTAARAQRDQRQRRQRLLRLTSLGLGAALLVSIAAGAMITSAKEQRAHEAETKLADEDKRELEVERAARKVEAAAADKAKLRSQAFVPYAQGMDRLMRGEGHYSEAAKCMTDAIAIDPDFSEAQFALGEALRLGGDPVKAETAYLQADSIDRQNNQQPNIRALLMAGFADLDAWENAKARALFAQVDQLGKDDPLALTARALAFAIDGRLTEARTVAQQAVNQAPLLWETHCALGSIGWGEYAEGTVDPAICIPDAVADLQQALMLSPNQPVARLLMVRALARSKNPEDKAQFAALLRGPGEGLTLNPSVRIEHAVALLESGNTDDAEKELDLAEKDGAPPTALRFGRVGLAKGRGDMDACYTQLASLVHDQESFAILVGLWVRVGLHYPEHRKEVTDFFTDWSKRHPDYPGNSAIRAQIALEDNDLPTAESELAKAKVATPFRRELPMLEADFLRQSGKPDAAMAAIAPLVAANPGDFDLRIMELETIAKSGDLEKALDRLHDLEKDFPDRGGDIARLKIKLMGR